MTSPANSRTDRDGQRVYTWKNEEFVSVTSAISVLSKPQLVPGARKVQAEEILSRPGHYIDHLVEHGFEKTRMYASRQAKAKWDETAVLGNQVHAAVESCFDIPGGFDVEYASLNTNDDVRPYAEQFIGWWKQEHVDCIHSEVTGYNRKYNYAGTIDLILTGQFEDPFSEITYCVDLKTGAGIYDSFALQLAAYRQFEFLVIDNQEVPMPATHGAAILHLRPDSCTLVPVNAGWEAFKAFLACRELHQWQFVDSKGVFIES